MEATKKATSSSITQEKFSSFLTGFLGHNPDPEGDPQPPGPWDPVIRRTFEKVFGPQPEPWSLVALNPQPLPPRWAFAVEFIRSAVDRLVLIQETADVIRTGDERGIIIVGGKVSELVDFVCGNNFPRRIPRPRPGPDPNPLLTGQELILMGAEVVRSSKMIANEALAREFTAAGEKLIDTGLERL
jgi:hypothetical protein